MKRFKTPILLFSLGVISVIASAIADYYTNGNWFARSGSILTFTSVLSNFIITSIKRKEIISVLEGSKDKKEKANKLRTKDTEYKSMQFVAFTLGLIGTIIWGYGDLLF